MPVPARLSHALHETLGDEAANDLVDWMQRVDLNRLELRDVNELNFARVDARFSEFEVRMDARFKEADARMEARFKEVDARFARVDARFAQVDARFDRLEARIDDTRAGVAELKVALEHGFANLYKWSFVFWVGAVGAIAALAKVLP